jgi:prephenate dehydrogenase
MELLVVGAGAMGRWLAQTVEADVAFVDSDPAAAEAAAAATGGRAVDFDVGSDGDANADGNANANADADANANPGETTSFAVVCLAVPMPALEEVAGTYLPLADEAALDVTGAMDPAVDALRAHAPDCERVSLHPLFAPENAPGNVAVVPDEPGPVTDALLADVEAAGSHVFETTVAEHDRAMESVQSAAHAAVLAYALAVEPVREEFHTPISARLAELVATVTDGTPRVYRDIQARFPGADRVAEAAARIAALDAGEDGAEFAALYAEAADSPFGAGRPDGDDGAGGRTERSDGGGSKGESAGLDDPDAGADG